MLPWGGLCARGGCTKEGGGGGMEMGLDVKTEVPCWAAEKEKKGLQKWDLKGEKGVW